MKEKYSKKKKVEEEEETGQDSIIYERTHFQCEGA